MTQKVSHPLMEPKAEVKKVLLVALNSDRGLCGAFNTNVNKFAENYYRTKKDKYEQIDFFTIGKKAYEYLTKKGFRSIEFISKLEREISYELAADISEKLLKTYLSGEYDEIRLIYNEFKSAISQKDRKS